MQGLVSPIVWNIPEWPFALGFGVTPAQADVSQLAVVQLGQGPAAASDSQGGKDLATKTVWELCEAGRPAGQGKL